MNELAQAGRYHLAGVGGIGMSAVAQCLAHLGHSVTGSDRSHDRDEEATRPVFAALRRAGVRMVPQDGAAITAATTALIVSTAIEQDNAELAAATRFGVPVVHRAKMLAGLAHRGTCVAVTGTSGKTTVTGMVGWLLYALGRDPFIVNGGLMLNWAGDDCLGNVRVGNGQLWVVEADESDRSLMEFHPDWAVITNVSKDHFELMEVQALFARFAAQVRHAVVGERELAAPDLFRVLRADALGTEFAYAGQTFRLNMPGLHNVHNAMHALLLCERMGADLAQLREALPGFRGIHRRLERVGEARGVVVYDDYAHNPAKLRAAAECAAALAPRVTLVWRPHGHGPLQLMLDEIAENLAAVCRRDDRVFIRPVFYAGGTAKIQRTPADLADALRARGVAAEAMDDEAALLAAIAARAASGDIVMSMGARDPDLPSFARRLLVALA